MSVIIKSVEFRNALTSWPSTTLEGKGIDKIL